MPTSSPPSWTENLALTYVEFLAQGLGPHEAVQEIIQSYPDVCEGKAPSTVERALRKARRALLDDPSFSPSKGQGLEPLPGRSGSLPPPLPGTSFQPLVLPYKDSLVWCDVHVPYHMPGPIQRSIDSAVDKGIKRIVLAGDFMDVHWGSRYIAWKTRGLYTENIKQEFKIAQVLFETILDLFDEVIIIPGNHDGGRFMHMSQGSIDFDLLCSFMAGYRVGEKPEHLIIGMNRWLVMQDSPWGDWRITHPRNGRAVPLSLAETLASKYGMNILTAHQHFLGSRMHRDGRYVICDGGHLQDERLVGYKQEVDSAHSNWTAGWVELVDGWPLCYAAARRL